MSKRTCRVDRGKRSSSTRNVSSCSTTSAWRQQASQLFRALHRDLAAVLKNGDSIYHVFGELVPICVKAHENRNTEDLRAIYSFVHWCWDADVEADEDLSNAAGVAFLEHIGHSEAVRTQIADWVRPQVFRATVDLWASQLEPGELLDVRSKIARENMVRCV